MDVAIKSEVILIALFALCVFLFLCNFGMIGVMGNAISGVMFGFFGFTAYRNRTSARKLERQHDLCDARSG